LRILRDGEIGVEFSPFSHALRLMTVCKFDATLMQLDRCNLGLRESVDGGNSNSRGSRNLSLDESPAVQGRWNISCCSQAVATLRLTVGDGAVCRPGVRFAVYILGEAAVSNGFEVAGNG